MSFSKHPYTLFRSRRRTASLEVSRQGELIVRVPHHMSKDAIDDLIVKHHEWVEKKRALILKQIPRQKPKAFISGETFPYLGKEYPLSISDDEETWTLRLVKGSFSLPAGALPNARAHFVTWYRQQATEIFRDRVIYFMDLIGVTCRTITITGTKSIWGSCSLKGTLRFTWHLVLTPPELIDYVVVHEVCHLKVHNHSKQFWSLVAGFIPDYKERRKRLRDCEYLLTLFAQ